MTNWVDGKTVLVTAAGQGIGRATALAFAAAGARDAHYIFPRLPHEVRALFEEWLESHFPERATHVMSLVRQASGGKAYDARFGVRQRGRGPYADMLGKRFAAACARHGLGKGRWTEPLDCSRFEPPGAQQLGLGF